MSPRAGSRKEGGREGGRGGRCMLIRGGISAKSFGRNCKGRKEKGGGEI